jgi:hypothetical protein
MVVCLNSSEVFIDQMCILDIKRYYNVIKMKRLLLVMFVASLCGVSVATRAWAFGYSLRTIIQQGLLFFILCLVLGIVIVIINRKP